MSGGFPSYDTGWDSTEAFETPGWTAQNVAYLPREPDLPKHPEIPDSIDVVRVYGRLTDYAERGRSGWIRFRCRTRLFDSASGVTVLPAEVKIEVKNGRWEADLLVSEDPDIAGIAIVEYEVTEGFLGGEKYTIRIPWGTEGPIAIESLRSLAHTPMRANAGLFIGEGPPPEEIEGSRPEDDYLDVLTGDLYTLN